MLIGGADLLPLLAGIAIVAEWKNAKSMEEREPRGLGGKPSYKATSIWTCFETAAQLTACTSMF